MGFNKDTDAVVTFASSIVNDDNAEINGIIIGNTTAIIGIFRQLLKNRDLGDVLKAVLNHFEHKVDVTKTYDYI